MTTYKKSIGKRIKRFATDLDNEEAEGQIFYSNTDNQFKAAVTSSAWSSSGPLVTGRGYVAGCGTQTAGLAFGGNPVTAATEEYNGAGWGIGGDLNTSRRQLGGAGTQTAGLAFGGSSGYPNIRAQTEEYNGTSWSEQNDLSTARYGPGSAGTQTAALAFGGSTNPSDTGQNLTEEYDGSSWTNGGALNLARYAMGSAGTQTAALAFGGRDPSPANTATEQYNGTSWTSLSATLNTARHSLKGFGTTSDALAFGGELQPPGAAVTNTEQYDGSTWTTTSSLAQVKKGMAPGGNPSAGFAAGGGPPTASLSGTEEYNTTVNSVVAAAFSAGGNLNTARSRGTGGGTLTAGICVNGVTVDVEEYDGTSWSEQNNMPTALRDMSGFGTQTAFVGCAGYQPGGSPVNTGSTYEYDGSDWTSGGTMNVKRDGTSLHFGGVSTAGLVNGGGTPPYKQTEEYNGTSWANANASSQHHYRTNITGTQTAAFIFGGYGIDPGGPQAGLSVTFTEEYDGTNFSSGDTLLQGANAPLGMSNSNKDDSTCAGGFDQASGSRLSLTQNYNGTAWATGASLGTARYAGTGGGSAAGGFVASGNVPPTTAATEELTAETTSLNLKTITDS